MRQEASPIRRTCRNHSANAALKKIEKSGRSRNVCEEENRTETHQLDAVPSLARSPLRARYVLPNFFSVQNLSGSRDQRTAPPPLTSDAPSARKALSKRRILKQTQAFPLGVTPRRCSAEAPRHVRRASVALRHCNTVTSRRHNGTALERHCDTATPEHYRTEVPWCFDAVVLWSLGATVPQHRNTAPSHHPNTSHKRRRSTATSRHHKTTTLRH